MDKNEKGRKKSLKEVLRKKRWENQEYKGKKYKDMKYEDFVEMYLEEVRALPYVFLGRVPACMFDDKHFVESITNAIFDYFEKENLRWRGSNYILHALEIEKDEALTLLKIKHHENKLLHLEKDLRELKKRKQEHLFPKGEYSSGIDAFSDIDLKADKDGEDGKAE